MPVVTSDAEDIHVLPSKARQFRHLELGTPRTDPAAPSPVGFRPSNLPPEGDQREGDGTAATAVFRHGHAWQCRGARIWRDATPKGYFENEFNGHLLGIKSRFKVTFAMAFAPELPRHCSHSDVIEETPLALQRREDLSLTAARIAEPEGEGVSSPGHLLRNHQAAGTPRRASLRPERP